MVLAVFSFEEVRARVEPLPYDSLMDLPEIQDIAVLVNVTGWYTCELIEFKDGKISGSRGIRYDWYKCRCYLSGLLAHLEKTLPLLRFKVEGDVLYVSDSSGSIDVKVSIALFYKDDTDFSEITETILLSILDKVTGSGTVYHVRRKEDRGICSSP